MSTSDGEPIAYTADDAASLPRPPAEQRGGEVEPGVGNSGSRRAGSIAIVRCSRGGFFETLWIPLVSVKAVRLGLNRRLQRCPVHGRWELVRRVAPGSLTSQQRAAAARFPATRIP